ncbi:hypothetical protein AAFC00_001359 [Neodothiora populina]|uniref:XRCC4 coiled-coil domain-containing protein n=1 Tax=Neodothiora populina TaxID=2781224 RepID=A0ABR3PNQ0_9PEZI
MSRLLKVRRTDQPQDFILVHCQPQGPGPLDLRLVGTDGQQPFVATITQASLQDIRSSGYNGTDEEWRSILEALLAHRQPNPDLIQALDPVASVNDETISITIRKNISGITQRLGTIALSLDEDEPIELFDWAGLAAEHAKDAYSQVASLQHSLTSQKTTIEDLTNQLDRLVKAKENHEQDLLKRFSVLLNSKKSKIREQQRLLARANVGSPIAVHSSRRPGSSQAGKRKARRSPAASDTSQDGSDEEHVGLTGQNGQPSTPDKSDPDDASGTDTDGEGFEPLPPPSQASRSQRGGTSYTEKPSSELTTIEQPPPRRELPFAKNYKRISGSQPQSKSSSNPAPAVSDANSRIVEDGDATEDETDDEL